MIWGGKPGRQSGNVAVNQAGVNEIHPDACYNLILAVQEEGNMFYRWRI